VLEDVADFVFVVETFVLVILLDLILDVETTVEVLIVELEIGPTTPPGPLTLEIPVFCKEVGNKGWISFCHTVV
tara:strand:+ start:2162 stop:2383 length:222 start_codon:yes stop_codon:yes gene_type:complete